MGSGASKEVASQPGPVSAGGTRDVHPGKSTASYPDTSRAASAALHRGVNGQTVSPAHNFSTSSSSLLVSDSKCVCERERDKLCIHVRKRMILNY